MSTKIVDLNEHRRKKKPQTDEEFARDVVQYIFNPARMADLEEPVQLASGKTTPGGSFVPDGDDEIDDEDIHEER